MAPPANISHLLVAVILATMAIATSTTARPSQVAAAPTSSAAEAFLRSRCAITRNATACYNALLPFAGTFNGSQVKISRAATSVGFGLLRSFLTELQRLQAAGGTGAGTYGDQALGACVEDVGVSTDGETEAFSYLSVLDTPGTSKEKAEDALFYEKPSLGAAGSSTEGCIGDFVDAGHEALASAIGKKAVVMARNCEQYLGIALDLVVGIIL